MFTDAITILKELGGGLINLKDLPRGEREHYRDVMTDTYQLIDQAIMLVVSRFGDLLQLENPDDFARELRSLDNNNDWLKIERDVRLCSNLRAAGREMAGLEQKLRGRISLTDWSAFRSVVQQMLDSGERSLADGIGASLQTLASMADAAATSATAYEEARRAVKSERETLLKERQSLITSEIELINNII